MGPEPISLGLYFFVLKLFFFFFFCFSFLFLFCLSIFSPGVDAGFTKRGGGGGRRCKHWPPGAGDPRYATALERHDKGGMVDDWWQSAPGKTATPPALRWESGGKKCGDLSRIYGNNLWMALK